MPGYGFSGKPTRTGWGPERMGRAWDTLMQRLGYTRYVAQGGDWGAFVVDQMGLQAPAGLLAIHTNMPATVPADIDQALRAGDPQPSGLSAEERRAYAQLPRFVAKRVGVDMSGGVRGGKRGRSTDRLNKRHDQVCSEEVFPWLTIPPLPRHVPGMTVPTLASAF
jgi:pimeloyl-ACP methyl ester carboxylesterase